jgi:hypothetical protein
MLAVASNPGAFLCSDGMMLSQKSGPFSGLTSQMQLLEWTSRSMVLGRLLTCRITKQDGPVKMHGDSYNAVIPFCPCYRYSLISPLANQVKNLALRHQLGLLNRSVKPVEGSGATITSLVDPRPVFSGSAFG